MNIQIEKQRFLDKKMMRSKSRNSMNSSVEKHTGSAMQNLLNYSFANFPEDPLTIKVNQTTPNSPSNAKPRSQSRRKVFPPKIVHRIYPSGIPLLVENPRKKPKSSFQTIEYTSTSILIILSSVYLFIHRSRLFRYEYYSSDIS